MFLKSGRLWLASLLLVVMTAGQMGCACLSGLAHADTSQAAHASHYTDGQDLQSSSIPCNPTGCTHDDQLLVLQAKDADTVDKKANAFPIVTHVVRETPSVPQAASLPGRLRRNWKPPHISTPFQLKTRLLI